jgi:MFS family permease
VCNEETAPELRGRVMALFGIAFLGSTAIGGPLVGWLSEAVDPRAGLAIGGVAALVTAAMMSVGVHRERAAGAPDDDTVTVAPADLDLATDYLRR